MTFRSMVLLYCIHRINQERTIFGVYHILKGKKSSQTIQDGILFELAFLYQTFPSLSRDELRETIILLEKEKYIIEVKENTFKATEQGAKLLHKFLQSNPFPSSLNGMEYADASTILWKRLSLTIQTVSHLIEHDKRFIPISNDVAIKGWVKRHLLNRRLERETLAKLLYRECLTMLHKVSNLEASIFVLRLSGFNRIGLTMKQVAEAVELEEDQVRIIFQAVLHLFVEEIRENTMSFPELSSYLEGFQSNLPLTTSAKKTYQLLNEKLTIEQISIRRSLKRTTIEDHIVEIALHDNTFTIEIFVDKNTIDRINHAIEQTGTRRMRQIKDCLDDSVSYFQIRLVLAKEREKHAT